MKTFGHLIETERQMETIIRPLNMGIFRVGLTIALASQLFQEGCRFQSQTGGINIIATMLETTVLLGWKSSIEYRSPKLF